MPAAALLWYCGKPRRRGRSSTTILRSAAAVLHPPRGYFFPAAQGLRGPRGSLIRMAPRAAVRNLQSLAFSRGNKPERVRPHVDVGNGLLDLRQDRKSVV